MKTPKSDKFSASEQGLGYLYQTRLALLSLLEFSEDTTVFLEKYDDLDFNGQDGIQTLASLKHKSKGDRLTDLSPDFWKSVRIWLDRYNSSGRSASNLRFFLFTTSEIPETSIFLKEILRTDSKTENKAESKSDKETKTLVELAEETLIKSTSKEIVPIAKEFNKLTPMEKHDFLSRILIFDKKIRIEDIPETIKNIHMRTVQRDRRGDLFERLEGWWNEETISQLTGKRDEAISGYEVSDKLSALSDEYKADNLPITFRGKEPEGEIDTGNDPRTFVVQLREIGISSERIRIAILDFYRAYAERGEWARRNLLVSGETEEYEDRLVDEWSRYKAIAFENLDQSTTEDELKQVGKTLYLWADQESPKIEALRIRARVTESYITRGSYHMLADKSPIPRVYWHPQFLIRISELLEAKK
tara:strand:+ start:1859 stop:3109 length:1251 start_codon:yes stop_codon:yes gene_type:complete